MTEYITNIPVEKLKPFPNHPFQVRDDDSMRETVESIKTYGVLQPAIVRPSKDGDYEILSGHRRKHASELAGRKTIPAIVRELDDDAAIIFMLDSNLQRENILPSERAAAYKMKMEALKRQGVRTDLTSSQVETKLRSDQKVAEEAGESRAQIQRYIRLTELQPELQQMVDEKKMAFTPAVEISYLKPDEQRMLLDTNAGFRTHNGAEFQSNTIRRILKNEIYIGYIVNGEARSDRIESLRLISDEDFNFTQEILRQRTKSNDEKRTIAMSNKGKALLSGNIFCAHCGCRLATSRYKESYIKRDGTSSGIEYPRYVCYHRSCGLNDCDGASTYNAEKVDSAVMSIMRSIFANISGFPEEEKIQEAYRNAMSTNHAMQKKLEFELQKNKKQLEVLRGEISKSLTGESIYSSEDLSIALDKLKSRITEDEEKLERLKTEDDQKKLIADSVMPAYRQFRSWAEEFEDASLETKKMIACQLFSRVEVGKGYKIKVTMNMTYRQFVSEWGGEMMAAE